MLIMCMFYFLGNVVWLDKSTAAKAMCSLSKNPYEVDKKGKKDGEKERKNKEEKTAEKEKMDTKGLLMW